MIKQGKHYVIRNTVNGSNVYAGVVKDYTDHQVLPRSLSAPFSCLFLIFVSVSVPRDF